MRILIRVDLQPDRGMCDGLGTHIFQPSQLLGQGEENRPLEHFIIAAWPAIDWQGGARKYRSIAGADVARALLRAANDGATGAHLHQWADMKVLLSR